MSGLASVAVATVESRAQLELLPDHGYLVQLSVGLVIHFFVNDRRMDLLVREMQDTRCSRYHDKISRENDEILKPFL